MVKNDYTSTTTNHVSLSRSHKKEYGSSFFKKKKTLKFYFSNKYFREELQKIFPKNKVKPLLMLKVQHYVVYKLLNHAVL
jgi:hypothetical protein